MAIENEAPVWRKVAKELEKPTRKRRVVNIFKIEKYANDGETIIVPGKVLGVGDLSKKVIVAAYSFSSSAREKLEKKTKILTIEELMKKNPKGKNTRIIV